MSDTIEMAPFDDKKSGEGCEDALEAFPDLSPTIIIQREIPNSWRYKSWKIFGFATPRYASPEFQLAMVSMVSFLNPGLYNALSGLGGAGQIDPHIFDIAQTALYATFAVVAFNSGTVANVLGVRWTLTLGALGYSVFAASFLCFNHTKNGGFVIFAGIFLGWSAGLLWTAQGTVMVAYPPENSKGRYISWFWSIFNLGAVIGSIVPLSANFNTDRAETVNDKTYIAFMVLMTFGGFLPLLMCNGNDVVRSDGSWVIMPLNPTWKSEVMGLWYTLRTDSYVLLMFPMFFCSNWFYTYQFNGINEAHFNTRTRGLNNLLYWTAQIAGAMGFGYSVDTHRFRRTVKAKVTWVMLFCLTMGVWGGGLAWQLSVPDRKNLESAPLPVMDWNTPGYWKGMLLYMAYGFFDAVWQSAVYWFMGALTNSGRKTANFAGFYKGIQSAGAAIMWRMDSLGEPYMTEFLSNWILLASALIIVFPVIWFKINDHIPEEDELDYDENEIAEHDTADNYTAGDGTLCGNTEAEDPPRQRLEPRDEITFSHAAAMRPLPPPTETLAENAHEESDSDPPRSPRPVSGMTLAEAVAILEAEAPEYLSQLPPHLLSDSPIVQQRHESNRFSRAFANHRQVTPIDI